MALPQLRTDQINELNYKADSLGTRLSEMEARTYGLTATPTELNTMDGVTASTEELNIMDGVTASTEELNIMDGVTATAAELNTAADLSVNGGLVRVKKIAISSTPTGAVQDTSWDLPAKSIVLDVFVDVTTVEATGGTKTMTVGLKNAVESGDEDGFLAGISVATSTGIRRGVATVTAGGNETYFASTTRGAYLASLTAGADAAGDVGTYYEFPHICNGTAVSVVYTAGSNDWAEFRGAIYVVYVELG